MFIQARKRKMFAGTFGSAQQLPLGPLSAPPAQATGGSAVQEVTDATKVIPEDGTNLVMFKASWCSHCANLIPHFKAAATKFGGKAKFYIVDESILQKSGKAAELGINGFPHIAFVNNGNVVDKMIGNQGPQKLDEFITQALQKV
jgi:thioredoxin-like negative regulator of GroEL